MGGKTETYSDFYGNRVYADDSKLLSKEFIRQFANYKTISPNLYMTNIINSMSRYFSVEVLKRFNINGIVDVKKEYITYDSIKDYIDYKYTGDNKVPFYYGTKDINNNDIDTESYKAKLFFDSNFYIDTSFVRQFSISYDCIAMEEGNCNGMTARDVAIMLYGSDIVSVNYTFDTYMYSKDGIYRAIKYPLDIKPADDINPIQILTEVYTKDEDGNYVYDKDEYIDYIEDYRTIYVIKYAYGELCDTNMNDNTIIVLKQDILAEIAYTTCLVLPIKDNGNFVSLESYQKVLLNDYGFDYDDLKSSLDQDTLKAALLTYSTNRNNQDYIDVLDDLYGTANNQNEVLIESDYYDWSYSEPSLILFEGYQKSDDGSNLYLIPIDIVKRMSLEDKYKFIEQCLSMYGYSSETVDIKWYQTGFFKFLSLVFSFALAIYTFGISGILIGIGATAGLNELAKSNPELAAAVAIAVIIISGYYSGAFKSLTGTLQVSLQLGESYFKSWNQRQLISISKDIEYYKSESEEAVEAIQEMTSDFVYNPFNGYNSYYDTVYNLQYAVYSDAVYSPLDTLNATFYRR